MKKGDLLMTFDQGAIESKGLKTIKPVYEDVIVEKRETCQSRDVLMTIVK
ncbi:hypothetical protein Saga11_07440 [Bacillus safensis]|nr:hypothetical protein Saga11_07440 [Bacillus safensis]